MSVLLKPQFVLSTDTASVTLTSQGVLSVDQALVEKEHQILGLVIMMEEVVQMLMERESRTLCLITV